MNKAVLITGGSRGLGREVALTFGRAGWGVVVNYITNDLAADDVSKAIGASGGEALMFNADVSVYPEVERMVKAAIERFGRIDVLVNNAGIVRAGLIAKLTEQDWDLSMDTNLKGAFNTTRAVSRIMMKQRAGHIINIASILGVRGKAGQAAYSASKAGLIGLTKATAVELAPRGIQANAVIPGYMLTGMGAGASQKARDEALSDNLLKRFNDPDEVAGFIFHLAGMKSVSGQVFNLDSRMM
ncbi:MAG TPA: 3-oxoacyl-ACP reductase family protein [Nitrospirota bacterium]